MEVVVNVNHYNLRLNGFNNFEDWNTKPNTVYIGRTVIVRQKKILGSKWKNPFKIEMIPNGRLLCLQKYEKTQIYPQILF